MNWTRKTFIEDHNLFLHALTERIEKAAEEARQLRRVFRANGVPDGGRVLDLACGIGRHSVALAGHGYRVTGVDFSEPFIELASSLAEDRGVSHLCRFLVGDMRDLTCVLGDHELFDAAICMFTSLGYYDAETDVLVLKQVHAASTESGVLVIDMMNKRYLEENLHPRRFHEVPGELLRLEESKLDPESSRLQSRWRMYVNQGENLRYMGSLRFNNRVYSVEELKDIASEAGWTPIHVYCDLDGTQFSPSSKKIIIVSRAG